MPFTYYFYRLFALVTHHLYQLVALIIHHLNQLLADRPREVLPAGPETLEENQPTPAESETEEKTWGEKQPTFQVAVVQSETIIVVPKIPEDVISEILDRLAADPDFRLFLRSFSLISKLWVAPCRRHLFRSIFFNSRNMFKWLVAFPIPERSPVHHVRHLHLSLESNNHVPDEFFKRIQWFTNANRVAILSEGGDLPRWTPLFGKLSQSVTSLIINVDLSTVLEILDVMKQLPNLNDLSVTGCLRAVGRRRLRGIGTALRGKFGGCLRLNKLERRPDTDFVNMLLEVPTGLNFTEVHVIGLHECLLSTVRLAEACSKTLVKLSYTVDEHAGRESSDISFDFAKLPNLKEIVLEINWSRGTLHWIPTALSTLKPNTSSHLSAIRLKFTNWTRSYLPRELTDQLNNDLDIIENEVTRIKREFGAIDVAMSRDITVRP